MDAMQRDSLECHKCPLFNGKDIEFKKLIYNTPCFDCRHFKQYVNKKQISIYKDAE